jgi:siroheme synthase
LVVVTAHNCRNESQGQTIFEAARSTYALYMPGPDYSRTVHGLLESGHEPATPCAVVSNAGRANEEVRYLTLQELASAKGISAPAVLIVGEVARERLSIRAEHLPAISSVARDPYRYDEFQVGQSGTD